MSYVKQTQKITKKKTKANGKTAKTKTIRTKKVRL